MSAKTLEIRTITSATAAEVMRRWHYSGRTVNYSQVHFGIYWNGVLEGALQFGPPMDRRKVLTLVRDTEWGGVVELNRMALSPRLPRNSESRALAVVMRLLRKHAPWVEWVVSFADGTQCGDGTIYRASGFVLTGIRRNNQIWVHSNGTTIRRITETTRLSAETNGARSMQHARAAGYEPMPGYMLRYIYFLNPAARARLTVPILPFDAIRRAGARMALGRPIPESGEPDQPVGNKGAAMRPDGSINEISR